MTRSTLIRARYPLTAALLTGTVLLAAAPAPAKGVTVSLDEYRKIARDCRALLGGREVSPAAAKKLAARLRGVGSVTLPSGRVLPVDTAPEADALDSVTSTTPDKKSRDRFAALDEQLNADAPPAKTDPRLLAGRILSAREFAASQPEKAKGKGWDIDAVPKWLKPIGNALAPALHWVGRVAMNFFRWIGKGIANGFRAVGKFFRWIFSKFPQNKTRWNVKNPMASLGNGVLLTLYFIATVGAVVAVYFLSRYLFDLYETCAGRKRRAGALGGDLDLSREGITDPLGTASQRAAAGDYRSAIRLTYIAALWKLGESGILTLEKNRTNWEYQRALRQQSQSLHDDLLPATRLFDRVWYGREPGTETEFAAISAVYDKLPTDSPRPPQAGGASTTAGDANATTPGGTI